MKRKEEEKIKAPAKRKRKSKKAKAKKVKKKKVKAKKKPAKKKFTIDPELVKTRKEVRMREKYEVMVVCVVVDNECKESCEKIGREGEAGERNSHGGGEADRGEHHFQGFSPPP